MYVGKEHSQARKYPDLLEPATQALSRVNMDLYTSSVTSIEGYNHAVIFTDSHSEYRWQYCLKTKDKVLPASKRWFAEIADISQRFPLLSVVWDNSGKITSKEINDFFTENEVKNYFSTPCEQWQNGIVITVYNGAVRSKLIFPITLLSWHAWTMMRSSRTADVGHLSIHRRIFRTI
jgi:hypothetical protein